jgi:thiol-disulfide isomerase/thioredoxin
MNGKTLRAALVIIAIALSYIVPSAAGSADDARLPMPNLLLADGSAMPFPLKRYLGNIIVLEFWSKDCVPCLKELEYLNRLQGDMVGKPVIAIAVSEDNLPVVQLRAALSRQKLTFLKPFSDPGGNAEQVLGLRGLPTSFVIDRHGNLVSQFEGPQQWDNADFEKRINYLLATENYP